MHHLYLGSCKCSPGDIFNKTLLLSKLNLIPKCCNHACVGIVISIVNFSIAMWAEGRNAHRIRPGKYPHVVRHEYEKAVYFFQMLFMFNLPESR